MRYIAIPASAVLLLVRLTAGALSIACDVIADRAQAGRDWLADRY